jgi:hypothetical protein
LSTENGKQVGNCIGTMSIEGGIAGRQVLGRTEKIDYQVNIGKNDVISK